MYTIHVIRTQWELVDVGQTDNSQGCLGLRGGAQFSWTKLDTGWKLDLFEEYANRVAAMKREKCLRSGVWVGMVIR